LSLWRGEPLAEFGDEGLLAGERLRLRELERTAQALHAEARLRLGDRDGLVSRLESLTAAHPLDEALLGQLLRALAAEGRRAEALVRFDEFRRRLREELGADPSAALQQLHVALLRRDPSLDRVAGGTPAVLGPTNLRARLTSFVGREVDREELAARLARQRLVTLVGPGGAGKTRLAEEVARAARSTFRDGVWLVSLASVRDAADLPRVVLSTLSRHDGSLADLVASMGGDLLLGLVAALEDRRLLIVLDNCEHLIAGAAWLADTLLGGTRGVCILATSREPLGVGGEALWPVSSLDLPEAGTDGDAAAASPAVRLFCDRARAVQPGFRLDATALPAVLRICRDLDGMPLAIELAAARLRSLSAPQIAERLADRFRLLSAGSRTALPRHQTLRAVVDWSWDLLEPSERTLLRRLAVFVGSPCLEPVEDVCAGLPSVELLAREHVLEVLSALVDRSLVVATLQGEAMRYRLLETVRAYATERLDAAGETGLVRRAHAEHYLALAERADRALHGPEQVAWLGRLDDERAELRAALQRSIAAGEATLAIRLGTALIEYCGLRGLRERARDWLETALGLPADVPPLLRAQAYLALAAATQSPGGPSRGYDRRMVDAARDAYAEAGVAPSDHFRLRDLGADLSGVGPDPARAVELRARLVALREDLGDPWLVASSWWAESFLVAMRGPDADRVGLLESTLVEAERGFRALGDDGGLSGALAGLAVCAGSRGERERAASLLDDAFARALRLGWTENVIWSLIAFTASLSFRGLSPDLLPLLERGLDQAREQGSSDLGIAGGYTFLGSMAQRRQERELARRCYELALERATKLETQLAQPIRAFAQSGLVWVREQDGAYLEAWQLNQEALEGLFTMVIDRAGDWAQAADERAQPAPTDAEWREAIWLTGGCRQGARILARLGDAERAARLFGAGEAMLRLLPAEHQDRQRQEFALRSPEDDGAIESAARAQAGGEAAYAAGLAMSPDGVRAALLNWSPTASER
ncbi:MAG: BTAD domain-containing putative transcriptional regulator, partial [Candidatus Dormiibacterota bacterium]